MPLFSLKMVYQTTANFFLLNPILLKHITEQQLVVCIHQTCTMTDNANSRKPRLPTKARSAKSDVSTDPPHYHLRLREQNLTAMLAAQGLAGGHSATFCGACGAWPMSFVEGCYLKSACWPCLK